MKTEYKVTEAPAESSFSDIIAGDNVINIPLFQREYKWTDKNLSQFWDDIDDIFDGSKNSQFLGVIVTVPQPHLMGRPTIYDIVDGQQRLFTCYIAIMAAVQVALDNEELEWAIEAARSYLLLRPFSQYPNNTKLVPSAADRQQFFSMWEQIASHKNIKRNDDQKKSQGIGGKFWDTVGRPNPPSASGPEKGKLSNQYRKLIKHFRTMFENDGIRRFQDTIEILALRLSFVTISLRDPIAAPIIFERLNARGERITTADLVRNEIFSKVASDPSKAQVIFDNDWNPFIEKFTKNNTDLEKLLFPYGLIIDDNVTKADLFNTIRNYWSDFGDPRDIIADLDRYSPTLLVLETGEGAKEIDKSLSNQLLKFYQMGAPTSIYAFVLKAVDEANQGKLDIKKLIGCLEVIESFLVRRAVCGHEPTGLHAVFKGLWNEIQTSMNEVSVEAVTNAIKSRKTVPWPKNDDFVNQLKFGDLYSRRICRFILSEYELQEKGETPNQDFWIEHVLPQTLSKEWKDTVSEETHEKFVNSLANLIPLTSKMNSSESNNKYAKKRSAFQNSIFATPRAFAKKYENWTRDEIEARSDEVSNWAVARWKY